MPLSAMLDLELLSKQNAYYSKSRHYLDQYNLGAAESFGNIESEPELEVYVDKRLYQGKVSWKIESDANIDYALLPVTLEARGGNKGGNGGGSGDGSGEEPAYSPANYVTGKGLYEFLEFSSDFNIELEFVGSGWTEELYGYATSMAELYSYFITGDEANILLEETSGRGKNRTTTIYDIDDIYVALTIENIDGVGGTLGYAGPEYARYIDTDDDGKPDTFDTVTKGGLTLDSEDLSTINPGLIDDIIFHEIGHIIGFGTMFSYQDLVTGNEFTGENANMAYQAAYATSAPLAPLLLEDGGGNGTAGGHWEEQTGTLQGDEIMTGYINAQNWLSTVTIASYQDLGYETIWGKTLTTEDPVRFLEDVTPNWGEFLT